MEKKHTSTEPKIVSHHFNGLCLCAQCKTPARSGSSRTGSTANEHQRWQRSNVRANTGHSQQGMASILITLITMIVISLIVLGFAAISRREQRQSLDQQLSAQAFYAAESAVEDAKKVIQDRLAAGQELIGKDNCILNNTPSGNFPTGPQTILDVDNQVSYTCLKVDVSPKSASYDGVGNDSIAIPIEASGPMDRIEISWQPSNPVRTPADCLVTSPDQLLPKTGSGNWTCGYGVIRADLVPVGGALNRNTLMNSTMTGFYVPTNNATAAGQVSYATGVGQPTVAAPTCDLAAYGRCRISITGLGAATDFSMRLRSLYKTSDVTVTAYQGETPVSFSGAQVVIDATGKAQDVLRRIQVRVPLKPVAPLAPNYAIQTNDALCKRFNSMSGYFNIPGDIVNPDSRNPMCVALTDGSPPVPPCEPNHDIMLTLDTSGSMSSSLNGRSAMAQLQEVGRRFVANTNITVDTNNVGIVRFSNNAELGVGLTSDQNLLINYINGLNPNGGTNYIPALQATVDELNARVRTTSPRVIIFVSDGAPSDNKTQIRAATTAIKDAGVRLYTIGINVNPNNIGGSYDEPLLIDMAGAGGRYFAANDEAALQAALQIISEDLKCEV